MAANHANEFDRRFRERYDELKWLYCELYHNDEQGLTYLVTLSCSNMKSVCNRKMMP